MKMNDIIEGHTYTNSGGYLRRTVMSVGDLFVYYRIPDMNPEYWDCSCRIETFASWARVDLTEGLA